MLAALALLMAPYQEENVGRLFYLGDPAAATTRLAQYVRDVKLTESKKSPQKFGDPPSPFEFEWLVTGMGRVTGADARPFALKFRVFSQIGRAHV